MAAQPKYTLDEIDDLHALTWNEYHVKYPNRSFDGYRIKRSRTKASGFSRTFTSDKAVGAFNWREANQVIASMRELKHKATSSQDTGDIIFDVDHPICVVGLSDTHIMSWGSDHDLFASITDEIIETPNLYVALLGDLQQMSIKLRGVLEVTDNMFPVELQHAYIESWLADIQHKVLFACWDNHAVQREEDQAGFSHFAYLMKRHAIYHSGIGHPNVRVGGETYRFAVSHHFQGRSMVSPVYGAQRYLIQQGHDREIAWAGDSHIPGLLHFTHGATEKLALNAGSTQTNSGYGKRFFSLKTHSIFPCVELFPDEHIFAGHWSVNNWLKSDGASNRVVRAA